MTRVWERLYLGGQKDAEHLLRGNPHGITTVVSLCDDPGLRRNPAVNYVHFPIRDDKAICVGQFDAVIDAVAENIRWGTVLLHCDAGISRSPIMAAAWMHICGYKNVDAALTEIANLRPILNPSPVLLKSVEEHLR